jgi:hypothetical protein
MFCVEGKIWSKKKYLNRFIKWRFPTHRFIQKVIDPTLQQHSDAKLNGHICRLSRVLKERQVCRLRGSEIFAVDVSSWFVPEDVVHVGLYLVGIIETVCGKEEKWEVM